MSSSSGLRTPEGPGSALAAANFPERSAEAPAAVLLHGWPDHIQSYMDVVRLLTDAGYP